ncbi:MAG: hypothetical protein ACLGIP_18910 [Alphaproteobacteria bacterium]
MTLPDIRFHRPAPALTEAEIARNVASLPMPPTWTREDDVALMIGLFKGLSLQAIADRIDRRDGNVKARWLDLKRAAGVTEGAVPLDAQNALLRIVRARALPGGLT